MLEDLKEQVLQANLELHRKGLVLYTWGNVSGIDREKGIIAIKPSGVSYSRMVRDHIVLLDMDGNKVEGELNPSSDTPTHLELYKAYDSIGGICHTHSRWATVFSQSGLHLEPYGTTHADYFYGTVPCTRNLTKEEIQVDYEKNTGTVIIEAMEERPPLYMPAVLVKNHAPFTWGKDAAEAVYHAVVLEEVACMAWNMKIDNPQLEPMPEELLTKHFMRKHGADAYYGQSDKN